MNATDLNKLKWWRLRGGLTSKEFADLGPLDEDATIHLHAMETNMALALWDLLSILGVGHEDVKEVLGAENMEFIESWLDQEIIPMNEGARAYRMAKVLFEPKEPLEDYGLLPTIIGLPDTVWDALEETKDDRFVILGPIVLDQNTKTIYMAGTVSLDELDPASRLMSEQIIAASRAMKEADNA